MQENRNTESAETKKKSVGRELLEWVMCIAVALVITLLLQNYVFRIVKVDGSSMEPTLKNGERLVMLRLGYEPKAGDIVVVDVSDKPNLNRTRTVQSGTSSALSVCPETQSALRNGTEKWWF